MEFSRQEQKAINEACATREEIVQLPDLELVFVGGGVADVTLS
jgi:hypothetical protein